MLSRTTDLVKVCTRVAMLSGLMSLLLATANMGLPLEPAVGSNEVLLEEEEGVWSDWRDWIPCSRSCGAGVTVQNRTCLRGSCVGPSVQYMSCCEQDCPEDRLDFRALQCQEHSQGGSVQYVPADDGNEGCTLRCINPQDPTRSLITFIRNGTSCKTVEGFDGTCLGMMCARVGCDGVLGSDKIKDECLQCHSPNEERQATCQRFAAISTPNQAAMEGNLPVVVIPEGATTITISHLLLPNQGTLALKSPLGTYHYTHGMTASLQSIAGARFNLTVNKSGPHPREVLTSQGPISERIIVELQGVHQSSPMVEYEYYLIETSDDRTGMHSNHTLDIDDSLTDPGSEYAWRYEPFSECSVTCGTGIAVATAVCEDLKHPGRNLPDNLCSRNLETTKPLPIVQKCLLRECQPRWSEGEWSPCSKSCGNGTQTRQLKCLKFIEEGRADEWASGECNTSTKPEEVRICNMESCYAEWSTGPWTQCPTQCGRWDQQRTVVCRETATGREVDSTHCDPSTIPSTTQQCVVPCSECYWATSKFGKCDNPCGYGVQNRRIRCRYVANNHRANESCCEGQEVPERTKPCYATRRCTPEWVIHPYGPCQGDCCGEMKRERQVVCAAVASSGDLVVFPDKECNETLKPATTEICERTDCPRWHTSEWAQCDATCGNGNRFREVTCVRGNNIDERLSDEMCECSSPFKPTRVQSCPNLPTCPTSAPCPMDFDQSSCLSALREICGFDPNNCCDTGSFLMQNCPASCRDFLNQACP